jgi:hypothetical protein
MEFGEQYADSGRFPPTGWYPDADTGIYPVLDGSTGYQGYAGEPPAPRVDCRPARPAVDRVPARPPEVDHDPAHPAPAGYLPTLGELTGSPAMGPPPGRLARLPLDKWILAVGGLAATVAVIVAFATAGGSATADTAKTAQTATAHTATTRAALPGCVSPRAGR